MEFDITDPHFNLKSAVEEILHLVIDPELQINIIDLGLVYGLEIDEPKKEIQVTMTLSSKFCPVGDAILQSVKNCIEHHYKEYTAQVNLVWEPVWSYDNISEEGKRLLNA